MLGRQSSTLRPVVDRPDSSARIELDYQIGTARHLAQDVPRQPLIMLNEPCDLCVVHAAATLGS